MTWNRSDLERVAIGRLIDRQRLIPVERAALAYARWQGLTDETGIDITAAKAELEQALAALDELGPEGWAGLSKVADEVGDTVLIGLMRHSMTRSVAQVREGDVSNHALVETEELAVEPSKPRRKDKDR